MSCDNSNIYNKSCCPDTPYPSVGHESVPSLIDNLVYALYGEINKTVTGGRVVWDIPCDPAGTTSVLGVTRNAGEGLMCYLVRALNSSSAIYTGTFVGNLVGNASTATSLLGAANTLPYQSALNVTSFLPFGANGQVLGMIGSALGWVSAPAAVTATAIAGGTAGAVLWQQGLNNTQFTAAGIAGQILTSAGTGSPTWQTNFAGNAASASILQTSRSITLAGDVAGTNSFNGSSAITITTTIQPNSVALGTDTTGDYVATIAAGTSGAQTGASGLTIVAPASETTAATLALANSGVTAGVYGSNLQTPVLTVDATGRITSATTVGTLTRPGVSFFPTLAEGGGHIFPEALAFVDTNNFVRTAGSATSGRLGAGYLTAATYSATTIGGSSFLNATFERIANEQVTKLFVSRENIFILTSAGNVYAAGDNGFGQLGDGTAVANRGIFTKCLVSNVSDFAVSAGGTTAVCSCLAVTSSGQLWAWGANVSGQLGLGDNADKTTPVQVTGGAISGKTISKCYTFGSLFGFSYVIDNTGDFYSTGYNGPASGGGLLGDGTNTARNTFFKIPTLKADAIFASSNTASNTAACVWALRNGNLWATGENTGGQLGIGTTSDQTTFQSLSGISNVATLSACSSQSTTAPSVVALLTDGTLRTWGNGSEGALGTGGVASATSPQTLSSVAGLTFAKVQMAGSGTGGANLFALTRANSPTNPSSLYACGYTTLAFGDGGSGTNKLTLTKARFPSSAIIDDFCAFGSPALLYVAAKTTANELYTWGQNSAGQLGLNLGGGGTNLPQRSLIQ
jgi:alpha-tubulin suppressor-like RCC1 family protein